MEPNIWTVILFCFLISLIPTSIIIFLLIWLKKHPMTGKVIGKTIRETRERKFFIIILEDKKQRANNITTDEATWNILNLNAEYTMQKSDWYYSSNL